MTFQEAWERYQQERFAHSNDELYCDIAEDVWHVFTRGKSDIMDGFKTAHEIACKFEGMHRMITVMGENCVLSEFQARTLRKFVRDCRGEVLGQ